MSQTSYRTPTGRRVQLGKSLGRGGEGEVRRVRGGQEVAKLYWPAKRSSELQSKLEVMVARRPRDPMQGSSHLSFAWPSDVLLDAGGRFVGFLMPYLDTRLYRPLHMVYRPTDYPAGIDWKLLAQTARNLSSAIDALHREGYVAGDLNESNVLAATNTVVTFVDCDSMQVPDLRRGRIYRCTVGKPEYTAPELLGYDFSKVDRTGPSDRFALAVLLCQLLVWGRHPFSGRPPAQISDNIAAGKSIFSEGFSMAPGRKIPQDLLPGGVTRLFERALVEGHQSPDRRPSAGEWQRELDRLLGRIRACSYNPAHKYSDHLSACPWCAFEKRTGRPAFPGRSGSGTRSARRRPRRGRAAPGVRPGHRLATPPPSPTYSPPLSSPPNPWPVVWKLGRGAFRLVGALLSRKLRVAAMGCVVALLLVVMVVMFMALTLGRMTTASPGSRAGGAPAAAQTSPPGTGPGRRIGLESSQNLLAQAANNRADPGFWNRLAAALRREGNGAAAAASSGLATLLSSEIPSALDWSLGPATLDLLRAAGTANDEWLGNEANRSAVSGWKQSAQALYYLAHLLDPRNREWLRKIEPRAGLRVLRGVDWSQSYGDQDGGDGHSGVITAVPPETRAGWVEVDWGRGAKNWYRWGADGQYDLGLAIPWKGARA